MRLKVIFFDLFYTLIKLDTLAYNECEVLTIDRDQWNGLIEDQTLYNLRATGLMDDPFEIMEDLIDRLGIDADDHHIKEMTNIRLNRFGHAVIHVEEKIIETLNIIKSMGIKLCLISNADVMDVYYWQESPLSELFDEVLFSYKEGVVKPDEKIYRKALKKMNVSPKDCLFVGDGGSNELMGAKNLGIETVQTSHFLKNIDFKHDVVKDYADHQIMDIEELLQVIEEVNDE